jgi:hypothetical protein
MEQKARLAAELLARGLTVKQIVSQLRCSPAFVRRVRSNMEEARARALERRTA